MNNKWCLIFLLILFELSLSACGESLPKPNSNSNSVVPDVETPFYIEGVELVIQSVNMAESYADYKPSSTSDRLLIVTAEVMSIPDTTEPNLSNLNFKGEASLAGDWGYEDQASYLEVYTGFIDSDIKGIVRWVFVVPNTAQSFTLALPEEQSLILDAFLEK